VAVLETLLRNVHAARQGRLHGIAVVRQQLPALVLMLAAAVGFFGLWALLGGFDWLARDDVAGHRRHDPRLRRPDGILRRPGQLRLQLAAHRSVDAPWRPARAALAQLRPAGDRRRSGGADRAVRRVRADQPRPACRPRWCSRCVFSADSPNGGSSRGSSALPMAGAAEHRRANQVRIPAAPASA
jgi:hypothetical protein